MPLKPKPIIFCIALAAVGFSSACGVGVARFNAEARSLEYEARKKFPVGSDAKAFETWFGKKGGYEAHQLLGRNVPTLSCEPKTMAISRAQGCMNYHVAQYCVNSSGKIEYLSFKTSGYC